MALSRLSHVGEICCANRLLLSGGPSVPFRNSIRAFRRLHGKAKQGNGSLTPFSAVPTSTDATNMTFSRLWKPFVFTIAFSSTCFTAATIWQYETMRTHAISILKPGFWQRKTAQWKNGRFRREVNNVWNQLTPGERVFVPICALNVLVFAAWRVPRLHPIMMRYFCSNPGSNNLCWPMLLSAFSHYSGFHLMANMYVLHSFSSGAVASLGKEQFVGFYLSAAVISSFASYLFKTVTKQAGFSLGASGAIMGILGYVCTQYPDTKLGIILVPFFTFSAANAIKAIVALDTAGVLLGWKLFDHAAHLGGAACGIAWATWGNKYLWHKRDPILNYWHKIRGTIK